MKTCTWVVPTMHFCKCYIFAARYLFLIGRSYKFASFFLSKYIPYFAHDYLCLSINERNVLCLTDDNINGYRVLLFTSLSCIDCSNNHNIYGIRKHALDDWSVHFKTRGESKLHVCCGVRQHNIYFYLETRAVRVFIYDWIPS